jgi:hypothetical protein
VLFEDQTSTQIIANKLVLTAKSPKFKIMFSVSLAKKINGVEKVEIKSCKAEDFKSFINYLYTDEIEVSESNAFRL